MQKTIRLLPLLLLARCSTSQVNPPPAGKLTNNDSPIRVTDTTTILNGARTQVIKVDHEKLQQYRKSKRFFVHNQDPSGNDTHQAVCIVITSPPSTRKLVDLIGANNWEIHFAGSGTDQLPAILADHQVGEKKKGDIAFDTDGFSLATDKLSISKAATVDTLKWKVDSTSGSSPLTVSPGWKVTIHYCPVGPDGRPKCSVNVDPCHP